MLSAYVSTRNGSLFISKTVTEQYIVRGIDKRRNYKLEYVHAQSPSQASQAFKVLNPKYVALEAYLESEELTSALNDDI